MCEATLLVQNQVYCSISGVHLVIKFVSRSRLFVLAPAFSTPLLKNRDCLCKTSRNGRSYTWGLIKIKDAITGDIICCLIITLFYQKQSVSTAADSCLDQLKTTQRSSRHWTAEVGEDTDTINSRVIHVGQMVWFEKFANWTRNIRSQPFIAATTIPINDISFSLHWALFN